MSAYFLPFLIAFLLLYSIYKKKNAYGGFISGAKSAFGLILDIFPYLVAILMLFEAYSASGVNAVVSGFLAPIFQPLGIPAELMELLVIKNFSGSGSIALLENLFVTYGADSYIGRCAAVITATSEAVFFVTAVYFSQTKVEKYGKAIGIVLITNLLSAILACHICKFI